MFSQGLEAHGARLSISALPGATGPPLPQQRLLVLTVSTLRANARAAAQTRGTCALCAMTSIAGDATGSK